MKTRLLAAIALLVLSSQSSAVMLSLDPATTLAMPGDTVTLDITISGLGSGGAPSLGAFDFDFSYDAGALSFLGADFGLLLGDWSTPEAFTDVTTGLGFIDLAEVSFLSPGDLDLLQPDTFVLASLMFSVDVLAVGSSTLVSFSDILLSDGFGQALNEDGASSATIRNPAVGVPEPASLLLWGLGLALVGVGRLRAQRG